MKLCLAEYYSDKYPKGHVFEIDDVMRSSDCASGVMLRVHMGKTPTWLDLGWFIPQDRKRSNKACSRQVGGSIKSQRKAEANRDPSKANKPPKPGKKPRGRPRKSEDIDNR